MLTRTNPSEMSVRAARHAARFSSFNLRGVLWLAWLLVGLALALPARAQSPHAGVYIGDITNVAGTTNTGWFAVHIRKNGFAHAIYFDYQPPGDGGSISGITFGPDGSFAFDLPHRNPDSNEPGGKVVGTIAGGDLSGDVCDYTPGSGDPGCPGSGGNNPLVSRFSATRSPATGQFEPFGGLYMGDMTGQGTASGLPVSAAGPIFAIADATGNALILASPRLQLGSTPQGVMDMAGRVQADPTNPQFNYALTGTGQINGAVNYVSTPPAGSGTWSAMPPQVSVAGTWDLVRVHELPGIPPDLVSMEDFNGDNSTDFGILKLDPSTGKSRLYVMDGSNGNELADVSYGLNPVRGLSSVTDANGDTIPEYGALVEGSLFARIKDAVSNTLVGAPNFNASYTPIAFLAVGEAGGNAGPDVAFVGRDDVTGRVRAWVKEAADGKLVKNMPFSKDFVPFAAVALDNVGDGPAMEIAVIGINAVGKVQAMVKDAQSGNLISKISFSKLFKPLFFAAVPDANGDLTNLAVLGRNAAGAVQAQIKRASDGVKVGVVKFSKAYDPRAFVSFADSNGSGGGEVGVVGVNKNGVVRAQIKEISDNKKVSVFTFSKAYPPVDAIGVNGVAGTGMNELALLGENENGDLRLYIKDLLTGNNVINFSVP